MHTMRWHLAAMALSALVWTPGYIGAGPPNAAVAAALEEVHAGAGVPARTAELCDSQACWAVPVVSPTHWQALRAPRRGICLCPYDRDAANRTCGARSAFDQPGGLRPRCFQSIGGGAEPP